MPRLKRRRRPPKNPRRGARPQPTASPDIGRGRRGGVRGTGRASDLRGSTVSGVELEGGKPGVAASCCTNRTATFFPSKGKPRSAGWWMLSGHPLRTKRRPGLAPGPAPPGSPLGRRGLPRLQSTRPAREVQESPSDWRDEEPVYFWLITSVNAYFESSLFKVDLPDEPLPGFASTYIKAAEGVTCSCMARPNTSSRRMVQKKVEHCLPCSFP
jgi:hypothetical protein